MKWFLIVLVIIFLLFGILLFSALKIKISLSKNGFITIKYLFISFKYDFYGDNKVKRVKKNSTKKVDKKSQDKKPQKKEGYFKKIYSEDGLIEGTVKLLSAVKHIVSKIIHLVAECDVEKLNLNIKVATEDPADTAIYYGGVCAVVYPAIGLLNGLVSIRSQNVNVKADYETNKPEVDFIIIMKLRVFRAVKVAFSLIKELIQGGF